MLQDLASIADQRSIAVFGRLVDHRQAMLFVEDEFADDHGPGEFAEFGNGMKKKVQPLQIREITLALGHGLEAFSRDLLLKKRGGIKQDPAGGIEIRGDL